MVKYFRVQKLPSGDISLFVADEKDIPFQSSHEYKICHIECDDFLYDKFNAWADCYAYEFEELYQHLQEFTIGGFIFQPTHTVRERNLKIHNNEIHVTSYFEEIRGTVKRVSGITPLQEELNQFRFIFP